MANETKTEKKAEKELKKIQDQKAKKEKKAAKALEAREKRKASIEKSNERQAAKEKKRRNMYNQDLRFLCTFHLSQSISGFSLRRNSSGLHEVF